MLKDMIVKGKRNLTPQLSTKGSNLNKPRVKIMGLFRKAGLGLVTVSLTTRRGKKSGTGYSGYRRRMIPK